MCGMQMENVVGNRHKLHPCIKHERYRGSSQIKFSDGDPDSSRPWKTTNQVRYLHKPQAAEQGCGCNASPSILQGLTTFMCLVL